MTSRATLIQRSTREHATHDIVFFQMLKQPRITGLERLEIISLRITDTLFRLFQSNRTAFSACNEFMIRLNLESLRRVLYALSRHGRFRICNMVFPSGLIDLQDKDHSRYPIPT